jgi:hypothetical protein
MSKITGIIPPQNFEYVRTRIVDILNDEISNQVTLTSNNEIKAPAFEEKSGPFPHAELPLINVSLASGTYGNKHQGNSTGTYIFNIDAYAKAKSTDSQNGDTRSSIQSQRILGIVRAILENPIYKTLGFEPPFLARTMCNDIKMANPTKDDALNVTMGQITFHVVINETTSLIQPPLIKGYHTKVKVNATNNGYVYEGDSYE